MRWSLVCLVAGCASYTTVEEACQGKVPGERHLNGANAELVERINCYRRLVDLRAGRITRGAQLAAAQHANYLDLNEVAVPGTPNAARSLADWFVERPDLLGFTGETIYDRLLAQGALDTTDSSVATWEVFVGDLDGAADELIDDPYFRDVFFQPLWLGSGISEFRGPDESRAIYFNMIYAFPPARRLYRPIVYPADGQEEVPAVFRTRGGELDPLYTGGWIGYPITITVGAEEVTGGENPYELVIDSATLTGPEGEVPLIEIEPQLFPWGSLLATVILGPARPLMLGQTYEFEADITWNFGSRTVKSTFTTTTTPPPDFVPPGPGPGPG